MSVVEKSRQGKLHEGIVQFLLSLKDDSPLLSITQGTELPARKPVRKKGLIRRIWAKTLGKKEDDRYFIIPSKQHWVHNTVEDFTHPICRVSERNTVLLVNDTNGFDLESYILKGNTVLISMKHKRMNTYAFKDGIFYDVRNGSSLPEYQFIKPGIYIYTSRLFGIRCQSRVYEFKTNGHITVGYCIAKYFLRVPRRFDKPVESSWVKCTADIPWYYRHFSTTETHLGKCTEHSWYECKAESQVNTFLWPAQLIFRCHVHASASKNYFVSAVEKEIRLWNTMLDQLVEDMKMHGELANRMYVENNCKELYSFLLAYTDCPVPMREQAANVNPISVELVDDYLADEGESPLTLAEDLPQICSTLSSPCGNYVGAIDGIFGRITKHQQDAPLTGGTFMKYLPAFSKALAAQLGIELHSISLVDDDEVAIKQDKPKHRITREMIMASYLDPEIEIWLDTVFGKAEPYVESTKDNRVIFNTNAHMRHNYAKIIIPLQEAIKKAPWCASVTPKLLAERVSAVMSRAREQIYEVDLSRMDGRVFPISMVILTSVCEQLLNTDDFEFLLKFFHGSINRVVVFVSKLFVLLFNSGTAQNSGKADTYFAQTLRPVFFEWMARAIEHFHPNINTNKLEEGQEIDLDVRLLDDNPELCLRLLNSCGMHSGDDGLITDINIDILSFVIESCGHKMKLRTVREGSDDLVTFLGRLYLTNRAQDGKSIVDLPRSLSKLHAVPTGRTINQLLVIKRRLVCLLITDGCYEMVRNLVSSFERYLTQLDATHRDYIETSLWRGTDDMVYKYSYLLAMGLTDGTDKSPEFLEFSNLQEIYEGILSGKKLPVYEPDLLLEEQLSQMQVDVGGIPTYLCEFIDKLMEDYCYFKGYGDRQDDATKPCSIGGNSFGMEAGLVPRVCTPINDQFNIVTSKGNVQKFIDDPQKPAKINARCHYTKARVDAFNKQFPDHHLKWKKVRLKSGIRYILDNK